MKHTGGRRETASRLAGAATASTRINAGIRDAVQNPGTMTTAPIEPRDHLIGPCAQVTAEDQVVVDVGAVVRRLVLFERYTLHTVLMHDMAALVAAFSEGG